MPLEGRQRIYGAGALSAIVLALALALDAPPSPGWTPEMLRSAALMDSVIAAAGRYRDSAGPAPDTSTDPNRTGLIGREYTPLTTTVGHLEAKRTTAQPDMAGLLAGLLQRAGTHSGDVVAIGASGSFPALLAASLCATRSLGARPVTVISLGASSWGANDERFNLLHVYDLCRRAGIVDEAPAAVSLGGLHDVGADLDEGIRTRLREQILARGLVLLDEDSLESAVALRMDVYGAPHGGSAAGSAGSAPSLFINAGGGWANIGDHPSVLALRPGLHMGIPLPPASRRGVLQAMAAQGIPVVHLLDIRGLANRYGLRWDPVPNTTAGSTPLRTGTGRPGLLFLVLAGAYAVGLALILRPVARQALGNPLFSPTSPGRTW